MSPIRSTALLPVVLLGLAVSRAWSEELPSPQQKKLVEYDLSPTTESLAGYLHSLQPTLEERHRIETLIQQLADDDYAQRETATRLLLRRPTGISGLLEEAIAGDEPEIRWRARRILDCTEGENRSLLYAVLCTIEQDRLPGLCDPLLSAIPLCQEGYLQAALHRALAATATLADVPVLRAALRASDPQKRIAALLTLASMLGKDVDQHALALSSDTHHFVQAAAARVLARNGRRESLGVLVKLLGASELPVRLEAFRTLRALTGERFGYTGYETAEQRTTAIGRWQVWLATNPTTAELKLPLRDVPIDLGRLLVCDHGQNKLIEYDVGGQKLWERQVPPQPWACRGLPNGHRLAASYSERLIVEYDRNGTEVWKTADLPGGPTGIERLENGNTLVACTEGSQVVEIDPERKIVWRATIEGRPVDARRLENGRTLVALQNAQKIVELDADGKVAWEIGGVGMAFSAQRLPDGNTLVCSLNVPEVREFDPQGAVVWSTGAFVSPYSAQRLDDGNTVVVDRTGVTEIDDQGLTVRRLELANVSRAWRY